MEREIKIRFPEGMVEGNLVVPPGARGVVLFAHGSVSSRHSPRNRAIARVLQKAGTGTLLLDLLTAREEVADMENARFRFDIDLLARRLDGATAWLREEVETAGLRVGYFGASTGAAAAFVAAASRPADIAAVVSRGGRPDLAAHALAGVRAPTLLIVGGDDGRVIDLNRIAFDRLPGEKRLVVIPGATHLFEEPGALEDVARYAAAWFTAHFGEPAAGAEQRSDPARGVARR
jgi:dienelactone hydrolase